MVSDLSRIHGQMRRLMDDMLYQLSPRFLLDQRIWSPQMDVLETPETFMIIGEVAGLNKDEIKVTVKKNLVYLAGKRQRNPVDKAVRYLQMEIEYGSFERTFELPMLVDDSRIEAHYREGLLTVVLPKKLATKKTIPIESE
ncbi:MAG: Hsp20/alpha crystallin family protein [Thermodesulfobacteriota bacterium]